MSLGPMISQHNLHFYTISQLYLHIYFSNSGAVLNVVWLYVQGKAMKNWSIEDIDIWGVLKSFWEFKGVY